MPVLIALVGITVGALGAWWVAWMRINFEREESLRSRMLDAADEFSASATRAQSALHGVLIAVPEDDLRDENGNIDYTGMRFAGCKRPSTRRDLWSMKRGRTTPG
jgi:hypothetical protein